MSLATVGIDVSGVILLPFTLNATHLGSAGRFSNPFRGEGYLYSNGSAICDTLGCVAILISVFSWSHIPSI